MQNIVNASGGTVSWFTAAGENVTFSGSQDPNWGWIDCLRHSLCMRLSSLIANKQLLESHGGLLRS